MTTYDLYDYETGDFLRVATDEEVEASREAMAFDGGIGAIDIDEATTAYVLFDVLFEDEPEEGETLYVAAKSDVYTPDAVGEYGYPKAGAQPVGYIAHTTTDRSYTRNVYTPRGVFRYAVEEIREVYEPQNFIATDDCTRSPKGTWIIRK